jgi:hypothetical protein
VCVCVCVWQRMTGDCFGEVALTLSNARVADVISEGAPTREALYPAT